jgi:hypothetical protein
MLRKMIEKYSSHILIIFMVIILIEGVIIFRNYKLEKEYKELINSKIISIVIETMENTSRIQNYLDKAKENSEISNKDFEQIAKWYNEMVSYAGDVQNFYNIYEKTDKNNYSLMDTHYFSRRVYEIEDILEEEYKIGKNVNDSTNINKYNEQFDKIYEFNSLFIETMVQKEALLYVNEMYWPNEKLNKNLLLKDNFYWNLYNDFFELLNNKMFDEATVE